MMRRNSQRLVCPKCRKHHHPRKTGREQTARFCQAVPRGDIRPTCVSARCGWLPRAAISTSREWAAIGEVAPLLLAAGTPKAPHLRIHTINTNRLTALIPRLSSGIVRRPAPCDRRGDLIGEHHRKGSEAGAPTPRNPPARFSFPPRLPLLTAEPPPPVRRQAPHRRATTPQTRAHQGRRPPVPNRGRTRENRGRADCRMHTIRHKLSPVAD